MFGLSTKTAGLAAMLCISRFVLMAMVLHVDVGCWVCNLQVFNNGVVEAVPLLMGSVVRYVGVGVN